MKNRLALLALLILILCAVIPMGCSHKTKTMETEGTLTSCDYFKTVQGRFWGYNIYKLSFDDATTINVLSNVLHEHSFDNMIIPETLKVGTRYHLTLDGRMQDLWTDTWWITEANEIT